MESMKPKNIQKAEDSAKERASCFKKMKEVWDKAKKYAKATGLALGVAAVIAVKSCGDAPTESTTVADVGKEDVAVVKDTGVSDVGKDVGEDANTMGNWPLPEGYVKVCEPTSQFTSNTTLMKMCRIDLGELAKDERYKEYVNNDEINYKIFVSSDSSRNKLREPINDYAYCGYSMNNEIYTSPFPGSPNMIDCEIIFSTMEIGCPSQKVIIVPSAARIGSKMLVCCHAGYFGEVTKSYNQPFTIYTADNNVLGCMYMLKEVYDMLEKDIEGKK
ncbi:MAG: hypothetical protein N3G76_01675 [Candidatus Micrarchaeota archaeon]|nr:hypothetical protein [Candidatus Micrarchaeota archaeon]